MQIVDHGALPPGTRDFTGIFGEAEPITAEAARAKVTALRTAKASKDRELRQAVEKNDGRTDLNALSRTVHRLATELAAAEQVLETAEALEAAQANEQKRLRLQAIAGELRAARKEFKESYLKAGLALGRWYTLGAEALELANALAPRLNGAVYYHPDLKSVIDESAEDPNPLPALKASGYREMSFAQSWRRHCPIVPMTDQKRENL